MDSPFLLLFFASLGGTLLAMPLARVAGARLGLLDHPEARKVQKTAVPRTGGIGVLAGIAVGSAFLVANSAALGIPMSREIIGLFVAGFALHLTGIFDDLYDMKATIKLFAQIAAVSFAVSQGVVIEALDFPGAANWELGALAPWITGFFLLGLINAVNLVDGLDGLASGIVAIGALALAIFGMTDGNFVLAGLSTVLFGAVLGFLPFNFLRNKTFLGDAGSMLLGYMLGVVAIVGAKFGSNSAPIFLATACAIMPILDTITTILRRVRKGQAIFHPDSMHLHHRLIRFGLSPRRTVLALLAVTLFSAGQSLVYYSDGLRPLVLSSSLAVILVMLQIQGQRVRNRHENDASFREILFYLLGAQDGQSPRMDGEIGMAEVLAELRGEPGAVAATAATNTEVLEEELVA